METIANQQQSRNKESIRHLYENILNTRRFELLKDVISEEYTGRQGAKGVEGFQQPVVELIKALPDAHWKVEELIAEGNKVVVRQTLYGTHTAPFQNIAATGKAITNDGIGIYELKDGKIVKHQIRTDRLSFLQELGVLPSDFNLQTNRKSNEEHVFFVDKFFVPKNSIEEFEERMNYNRNFIKKLDGFVKDEVFVQKDQDGNLTIITIAEWQSLDSVDNAKKAVQAEYKRIGFKTEEFYQRLGIQPPEREVYSRFEK